MTRTEWIAARRAMLAKKTPGPWVWNAEDREVVRSACPAEPHHCKPIIESDGGYYGPKPDDAAVIVAAVNEQEAVVRLVEAAAEWRHFAWDVTPEERALAEALDALVGEQETR